MPTIVYRYDYLKVLIDHPTGTFNSYYHSLREASKHVLRDPAKWDSSHRVTPFHSMEAGWERTAVDIWGEAAALVQYLPWNPWHKWFKRLDVRATLWEVEQDAVMFTGQRLQRQVSSLNIEVFSSKNAKKTDRRDRGGKGFRIGSRKSDVCVVVYKRNQEPAAQEFRFQGMALRNAIEQTDEAFASKQEVINLMDRLRENLEGRGMARLERVLNEAGIGVYWPLFNHQEADSADDLQKSFATFVHTVDAEEHAERNWGGEDAGIDLAYEDRNGLEPIE